MMDKSNSDSMTTVQMKADYAASEIYSTTSEAPPAYPMREANSVKIAKIIAATVLLSSLIIGCFVLGASYLQARASCDQMQALDSMLEKELMLETLQQELPKAEALLQTVNNNDDSATADDEDEKAFNTNQLHGSNAKKSPSAAEQMTNGVNPDAEYNDADESADLNRGNGVNVKMPLELNLSELAHAIMQSQQKSRMNCMIERRQAEEIVDDGNRMMFGGAEPRKRITGERMAIFCESGSESKAPEPQAEQIPIMMRPVSYGPIPQHFPHTHMPMQMEPRHQPQMLSPPPMPTPQQQPQQPPQSTVMRVFPQQPQIIVRQIRLQPLADVEEQQQQQQQQSQPPMPAFIRSLINAAQQSEQSEPHQPRIVALRFNIPPPQPEQVLTAPRPMMPLPMPMPNNNDVEEHHQHQLPYQIRNELMQLQKQQREREMMQQQQQQQRPMPMPLPHPMSGFELQQMPMAKALHDAGITADDLMNIRHMAEDRINANFKRMQVAQAAAAQQQQPKPMGESADATMSSSPVSSSSASSSSSSAASSDSDNSSDDNSGEIGQRSNGEDVDSEEDSQILQMGRRGVMTPIRIPVNLMQAITQAENMEAIVKDGRTVDPRTLVDERRPNIGEDNERR